MKKYILCVCVIFCYSVVYSQLECDNTFSFALENLNANAVRGGITAAGDLFYNGQSVNEVGFGGYYPPDSTYLNMVFAASFVVGGMDDENKARVAYHQYGRNSGNFDYSSGPLHKVNGTTDSLTCVRWDRVCTVNKSAILLHLSELEIHGTPIIRRASLYNYPAIGNPYFSEFNDFELPDNQPLAPFYDANSDGIYNPDDKDYPLPKGIAATAIPDVLMWSVFNDRGREHDNSGSKPLGIEVQLTAFAYQCAATPVLNQTLFTQYKVINRNSYTIKKMRVGTWWDFDIGCFFNDAFGNAAEINTVYGYDKKVQDHQDSPAQHILSGTNLPVVSFTYLNHLLDNSMMFWLGPRVDVYGGLTDPSRTREVYNCLDGKWKTGEPLTYGGTGYESSEDTVSIVYPDNPNDSTGWSMYTHPHFGGLDITGIASTDAGDLEANEAFYLDKAWSYHRGENGDHLKNVNLMYEQIPILQAIYDNGFANVNCIITDTEHIEEAQTIQLFPNPATAEITIQSEREIIKEVQVFDVRGRLLLQQFNTSPQLQIDLTDFSPQVYFIKVKIEKQWQVSRFIKI